MSDSFTILDGAMGTLLTARLGPGANEQSAALTAPQVLTQIHRDYIDAGSQIIYAATFGSNRFKAVSPIAQTVPIALQAAREAGDAKVALDVGPTGKMLGPLGDVSRGEAYEAFSELIRLSAGADLIVIETMFDLGELRAAILAARENSELPIYCTMSFGPGGHSLTGCSLPGFVLTAQSLGVTALGLNCSLGPGEIAGMLEQASKWADIPLICKPNAGMPDPVTGAYNVSPHEFARLLSKAAGYGAALLGGCCGTSPDYISALRDELEKVSPQCPPHDDVSAFICSASSVEDPRSCIICELTQSDEAARYLLSGDWSSMAEAATEIDCEALSLELDGVASPEKAACAVEELQGLVQAPLIFKSGSAEMLESALRTYTGRAGAVCSSESARKTAEKYGASLL